MSAEDFESDETLNAGGPGEAGSLSAQLESQFVTPSELVWRLESGKKIALWPLCNGGELIFTSAVEPQDSNETAILIWIFIQLRRGGKESWQDFENSVAPMARTPALFRGAFFKWVN